MAEVLSTLRNNYPTMTVLAGTAALMATLAGCSGAPVPTAPASRIPEITPTVESPFPSPRNDGERILAAAKKFEGVYYGWGKGYVSTKAFDKACPDPSNPPRNGAHNDRPNPYTKSRGNASPCAVDPGSLAAHSVNHALGTNIAPMITQEILRESASSHWNKIPKARVRTGDIIITTEGSGNAHQEFVMYANDEGVYTWGAHHTGTAVGPALVTPHMAETAKYFRFAREN